MKNLENHLVKEIAHNENLEKALIILFDKKVTLVSKKSEFQSQKKKEVKPKQTQKNPQIKVMIQLECILREMGGVELLSRDGEIAIAKRIEAGKNVMINALTQSPLISKKYLSGKTT